MLLGRPHPTRAERSREELSLAAMAPSIDKPVTIVTGGPSVGPTLL